MTPKPFHIHRHRFLTTAAKLYKSGNHMGNFVESMRSRKDPICDVEIGHRSTSVAHLGVISVRMNQALNWNPEKEEFTGANASEANQWLVREQRNDTTTDLSGEAV